MKKKAAKRKVEPKWRNLKSRKGGAKVAALRLTKETKSEPKAEPKREPLKPEVPFKTPDGCVECGAPLAPGQTYVCQKHVRAG